MEVLFDDDDEDSLSLSLYLIASTLLGPPEARAAGFTEDFGDLTSSSCDAAWDTWCEVGWRAAGVNDTAAMCEDGGNYGASVVPQGSTPTLVGRTVSVAGVEFVEMRVTIHVMSDGSEVGLRVVQKDNSGTSVDTAADSVVLDRGVYEVTLATSVKTVTSEVVLQAGGLTSGTDVWIDSIAYSELPTPPGADCAERAEAWRLTYYDACYDLGGVPTGTCIGKSDPSMAGGCRIECFLHCYFPGNSLATVDCLGS